MNKILIIDFDGTICDFNYPLIGNPKPGVKEAFEELKKEGFDIHILSCRTSLDVNPDIDDRIHHVKEMEKFLKKYNIPYDKILDCHKPVAFGYIDDRGFSYKGDWKKVVEEIKND